MTVFDAHLSALKVGLKLTPEQDKLWSPVETALREAAKQMLDRRAALASEGPPTDPVAGLRRMADRASRTGDVLRKIADAAQPLYQTLGEDQRRRLPILLHGFRPTAAASPERGFGRGQPRTEPAVGWGLPA